MSSEFRYLLGNTGRSRLGSLFPSLQHHTWNGHTHLVVPVVMLQESVIHAVNAPTPEFVPLTSLSAAPQHWNDKPLMLGHPTRDGQQISANDPSVLEAKCIGSIRHVRVKDRKLVGEAWVDIAKAIKLGAAKLVDRLRNAEPVEVSVGAFVTTNQRKGTHRGKPYEGEWVQIVPDHLALLPESVGACSISMGCGANRAAEQLHPKPTRTLNEWFQYYDLKLAPNNQPRTPPDAYAIALAMRQQKEKSR
jgi:hypothetical protein